MSPADIPFNVSYHFDGELREVPDSEAEMRSGVQWLREQIALPDVDDSRRREILGLLGVYSRILRDLDAADDYLRQALTLAIQADEPRSVIANRIRLAHVYHWQGEFDTADRMFSEVIDECERVPELAGYLDFALQHYGKSLFDQHRYDEAAERFRRALEIRLAGGNQDLIDSARLALDTARRRIPRQ